jgi:hypothetical protein
MDVGLEKHRPRKNHDKEIPTGLESEGGKMITNRSCKRCSPVSLVVLIAVCVLLISVAGAQAAGGASPVASHTSNAVSASVRAVQPAVSGLFQVHAPRAWVDALDNAGKPGKNGVPDFLDSWEAFGARTSSAILDKAYAFTTIDALKHEILYAGIESASSSVVLEFNQKLGERLLGDLRISAEIDAAGSVGTVSFESYAGEAKGSAKFLSLAILAGEGCNDSGTACVVANGALLEFGYNLTAFGKPEKDFTGIQITTPEDHVVGTFTINPVSLPSATCPSNLNSCTANDVSTTVKAVNIRNNDLCESLTDTIQLRVTTAYAATSNERYDLGLFVSGDGGTVQEPSTALVCYGAAAQAGQGDNLAYPDADTDLFLSIDPTGHSLTPSTTDTCGDLRASTGPVDWTVDVTVKCNIVSGELRIPSCRVWEQNANHKTSCTNLQQAGTGSKCDCTDLVVTTQLNPCATTVCNDGNPCTDDHCRVIGTAPNLSAECYATNDNTNTCSDGSLCTTDTCVDGTCTGSSSVTCQASDQCHVAGTCNPATGACSNPVRTGTCDDGNSCTTGETCDANGQCTGGSAVSCDDGNVCTTDGCNPASGCTHANNTNPCNDGNACTTGDVCSGGSCVGGSPPNCNDGNVCTNDSCNPASGCVNANNTDPCDDGNACTTSDTCSAGSCVGGASPNCDDGNVCTDDGCNPASGCTHTNNTAPCSDGNQCTNPDVCRDGACTSGPPVIIPG